MVFLIKSKSKEKSRKGGRVINTQCARILLGKVNRDLDCPSVCRIQTPDCPEQKAPGPQRDSQSPPQHKGKRAEPTPAKLYRDLPSSTTLPVSSRTGQQINDLPNPGESGGVEFGAQLLELIQRHRPSLRELERFENDYQTRMDWGKMKDCVQR